MDPDACLRRLLGHEQEAPIVRIVTRLRAPGEWVEHVEPGGVEGDGLPLAGFLRRLHTCRDLLRRRGVPYSIEQEIEPEPASPGWTWTVDPKPTDRVGPPEPRPKRRAP
jgi:hypothetical protein